MHTFVFASFSCLLVGFNVFNLLLRWKTIKPFFKVSLKSLPNSPQMAKRSEIEQNIAQVNAVEKVKENPKNDITK
jgi:hypothetical protein